VPTKAQQVALGGPAPGHGEAWRLEFVPKEDRTRALGAPSAVAGIPAYSKKPITYPRLGVHSTT
jgi:hypothetical protein